MSDTHKQQTGTLSNLTSASGGGPLKHSKKYVSMQFYMRTEALLQFRMHIFLYRRTE